MQEGSCELLNLQSQDANEYTLHDRKVVVIIRELLMFERFLRIALSRMFAQMLFILHNTLMSFLQ